MPSMPHVLPFFFLVLWTVLFLGSFQGWSLCFFERKKVLELSLGPDKSFSPLRFFHRTLLLLPGMPYPALQPFIPGIK